MKLPPLNAVRAFDAAGRHQSFLLAAKELHVSAASISRFIKVLEADLGKVLFTRHANGVSLTEMGEKYLLAVQPALHGIAAISHDFRQNNVKRRLNIVSIPAIAETWLVSRLWSFQQQHKDIQINLLLDDQIVTLRPNDATVWLTSSENTVEQSENNEYFAMPKDRLTLVCNPEIANSINVPADILNYPLLVDIDWQADWQAWLLAAGLHTELTLNHINFERYSMVVNAALAGSGVAIGYTALLESYLKMGTLVAPLDITVVAERQFFAVTAGNTQRRSVKQFVNWFVGNEYFEL